MRVYGDYADTGHAHIKQLLDENVVRAILNDIKRDCAPSDIKINEPNRHAVILKRKSFEVYGPSYTPLKFLLWGLTPVMEKLIKVPLEPTYSFFRIYRKGDICRVHSDRDACEHSLSLTLGYSDDAIWPFHVSKELSPEVPAPTDDFGDTPYADFAMEPGDAVMYRGIEANHARIYPNPNEWSAHIFLHWVERHGQFADEAFECGSSTEPVDFVFA
uniref:hypothetical protein n=1 Tax=Parerythrobacter lutipelagi TaxID=1964208 RepID=UPI0010F57476|nr:hypothetical protein [Parerythrobacter lutipelagi]